MNRYRLKFVLWAGFGAILLLLGAKWLVQFDQVSRFYELIVEAREAGRKMELVAGMIDVARTRGQLASRLASLDDPFERDQAETAMRDQAARYIELRDALRAHPLSERELLILSHVGTAVRAASESLERSVELSRPHLPERQADANRVLALEVLPNQDHVVGALMRMFRHQQEVIRQSTEQADALFDRVLLVIAVLTVGMVAATLLIAVVVVRKTTATERALHDEKQWAEITLGSIGDAVIATDALGRVEYMNPVAEALTGRTRTESHKRPIGKVLPAREEGTGRLVSKVIHAMAQYGHPPPLQEDVVMTTADGGERHIALTLAPIRNEHDRVAGVTLTFQDVTEARRLARKVAFQAQHDGLTGLLNRRAFQERVEQVLALYPDDLHALCVLDLDRFKPVNDLAGHAAGDALLAQLAARLRTEVRKGDLLARMGGDEFALFLANTDRDAALSIAEKLRATVGNLGFDWQGKPFDIGVSIGVAESSGGEVDTYPTLCHAADAACYEAKRAGRNCVCVADPDAAVNGDGNAEMHVARLLEDALAQDRFELYAQPVVSLGEDQAASYCELLLRLRDTDGTVLTPSQFLPVAERHGLMPRIDTWVVDQALRYLARQRGDVHFLVNLSAQSLADAAFTSRLAGRIDASDLDPSRLCFEISESVAVSHEAIVTRFAESIGRYACGVALDRYGSGLGTVDRLASLPVRLIKLDGELTRNIGKDATARAVVKGIVDVAATLGIRVAAQDIESAEVVRALPALGVTLAQGFHLGPPQPLPDAPLLKVAT